jgi:hypothetical protein
MQNIFTHVNQFYHSLVSAVCRGRVISLNSTPTMRGADCPSFLAMRSPIRRYILQHNTLESISQVIVKPEKQRRSDSMHVQFLKENRMNNGIKALKKYR